MRKVFPFLISGLLAVSFSQIAAAQSTSAQGGASANVGADVKDDTGTKSDGAGGAAAGQTANPNVNTDAHDRTHVNKGTHKGAAKGKKSKDMDQQSKAGTSAVAGGSASTQAAAEKSDNAVKSGAQSPQKSEKSD